MSSNDNLARERMAANPYAPIQNAQIEFRAPHALEYIAFYLGEIEKHLGKIADGVEKVGANSETMSFQIERNRSCNER